MIRGCPRRLRKHATASILGAPLVSSAHQPPPGFAPTPELVARIQALRIDIGSPEACPGERIKASYSAVLVDGSTIPFVDRYDPDDPPALHVVTLDFSARGAGRPSPG